MKTFSLSILIGFCFSDLSHGAHSFQGNHLASKHSHQMQNPLTVILLFILSAVIFFVTGGLYDQKVRQNKTLINRNNALFDKYDSIELCTKPFYDALPNSSIRNRLPLEIYYTDLIDINVDLLTASHSID
jgi:hypothetical protein